MAGITSILSIAIFLNTRFCSAIQQDLSSYTSVSTKSPRQVVVAFFGQKADGWKEPEVAPVTTDGEMVKI